MRPARAIAWAFLGGLSLMTTACENDVYLTTTAPRGVFTLTPEAPRIERHLRVSLLPRFGERVKVRSLSVYVDAAWEWRRAEGETARVEPWLRYLLVDPRNGTVHLERSVVMRATSSPSSTGTLSDIAVECENTRGCELDYLFILERQGPPSEGTVDVAVDVKGTDTRVSNGAVDYEVSLLDP
ncbi:hypothetical protein JY651_00865 [Pyxidicoccus parkwayensis]|jgi:hypothetical protein|uniref:Lipoprotein n=1 Tax=Pyxidicoccus parkwayensis TaxID=2813578 RepID=A0ABX7NXV0_9BACT|nr:hypothetical protein [Pyxidicoccus parkwaysis]QSQ23568.1 hypothetical protein JY651_00865 [Pyxidicoccus parkwaysis]